MTLLHHDVRREAFAVASHFRDDFFDCLPVRGDTLFELTDALLCADGPVKTPVDLTLTAEHRRGHGAMYEALNGGSVDVPRLPQVLAGLPQPEAADGRLVLAVDVTHWLRPDAPTSADRLFCHVYGGSGRSSDQFVPGWPYSFVAALESGRTSWCQILDALRLGRADDVAEVTAAGGEKTGALIILFENAPPKWRGLLTSLPAIGTGTGTLLSTGAFAVITGLLSEDAFLSWGWRIPFLFSAALTFFGLWVRRALPETADFQREAAPQAPAPARSLRRRITESRCVSAWRRYPKEMLIVIGAGAAENAGYYVFGTFSITYADDRGLATAGLLSGITAIAAAKLLTVPLFGALSDRIGRRPVSILGAALLLASAWPFFQIVDTGQTWAIWAALFVTLGIGQSAILGSQPAFFAELFDTSVRFSAVGVANNIGTVLTGGLAPMLCSALLLWFDHSITGVVIFIALMSALTIITVGLARETRHTDKEESAPASSSSLQKTH